MKSGLVVVIALAARAAHADEYPDAVVDRPLNLLPGMTAVYVSEEVTSTVTGTLDHREPDLILAHGFGPVEIAAELGQYAELHASLTTHGIPESIEIYALSGVPQADDSLHVAQGASVGQRLHLVPGQLALAGGFGFVLSENRYRTETGTLGWSNVVSGFVDARVEVQLLPQLALTAGMSGGAPIAHSAGPSYVRSTSGGGGFIITLHTWDIYANGGVSVVTDHWMPYVNAGFSKRWGR
jgi:hypothetical protein